MKRVKLVTVGDTSVGKNQTSLLHTYATDRFPTFVLVRVQKFQYEARTQTVPVQVFDFPSIIVSVGADIWELAIFDTMGQAEYDRLRPLSYPQTDVFLICFRCTLRQSFENIRDKWVPEVRHYCPDAPFLIVATQIDLRDDSEVVMKLASEKQKLVTFEEGESLAYELGAAKYLECSALTRVGVNNVFQEAIISSLKWPVDQLQSRWTTRRRIKCVVV
ncbi:Cell division control protein 42 [Mycena venus]|uniref:Cell division control protein 42 n=1 Tax=Mycena venus TaxID=2733690 RepID=A0A8H6YKU2_9AGAR|nr:Cell division control protein 42 [Mycena venus]